MSNLCAKSVGSEGERALFKGTTVGRSLCSGEVIEILCRKIISAFVSGTLFAMLLGLISPDPFGGSIESIQSYLFSVSSIIPIYMIYSLPAIVVYGVITSIVSEKIGEWVSVKANYRELETIISFIFHILFGLILLWYSLGAAVLFFVTDTIMKRRNIRCGNRMGKSSFVS
jgi:hypothetical protein